MLNKIEKVVEKWGEGDGERPLINQYTVNQ